MDAHRSLFNNEVVAFKRVAETSALLVCVSGLAALQVWWTATVQTLHGDLLYFESLFNDLVVRGHPISQFAFTEATFTFPDFFLFGLLRPLVTDPVAALILYCFAFQVIYFLLLFALYRQYCERSAWFFVFGLTCLVALSGTTHFYKNTAYWPNHHGAIQLIFLVLLLQVGSRSRQPNRRSKFMLVANFALAALTTFSDLLAVLSALIPAVTYGLYRRERNELWTAASLVGGIFVGQAFKMVAFRAGWLIGVPFSISREDWPEIVRSFHALPAALPEYIQQDWPVVSVFALLFALALWRKQPRAAGFRELTILSLLLGGFGLMASGRFPNSGLARYYQQFSFLPLIWIAVYGAAQLPFKKWQVALASVVGIVSLGVFVAQINANQSLLKEPELSLCLDAHAGELHSPWGLSSFFISKVVTFTNHTRLHVNQVKKNLSYDPWMNSPSWYREDRFGNPILHHTFLITKDASQTALALKTFGAPAASFACPYQQSQVDVLIYPQGILPRPPDNTQPN